MHRDHNPFKILAFEVPWSLLFSLFLTKTKNPLQIKPKSSLIKYLLIPVVPSYTVPHQPQVFTLLLKRLRFTYSLNLRFFKTPHCHLNSPGAIHIARLKLQPFQMNTGGEKQSRAGGVHFNVRPCSTVTQRYMTSCLLILSGYFIPSPSPSLEGNDPTRISQWENRVIRRT